MTYDLIIKNGTIIDGTGAFRRRADVAVKDGKVAEIGKVTDGASETIDASDLIVSPGFVDPHTHYDAQICWDPLVSCTSWHGVTTVVMGNCGVGIAPCKPAAREVAAWDLVNVEAIPFEALSKGITWEWETFPEFIAAAERRGAGINLAFLAPLTPFRHYVMGEESMEREATSDETARIAGLLREAVDAGAFGFSTTTLPQHIGYQGRPLACRLASSDELKAYANVLRDAGRGAIEVALTRRSGRMSEDEQGLLEFLLDESRRPVTWLAMASRPDNPEASADTLRRARAADQARRCAASAVQAVCRADGFAQSIFVRRHGDVGAGLQSAAREAEGVLPRPGFSRRLSRGTQAAASVPGQMESGRGARGRESNAETI